MKRDGMQRVGSAKHHRDGNGFAGDGGRVLVLDDDRSIRFMFSKLLPKLGVDVVTVATAEEAAEAYDQALQEGRRFDLVILDLTIPGGKGGEEVLTELIAMDATVKAVAFSGDANDPAMVDPHHYGFHDSLRKPLDLKRIGTILHEVMRGDA